MLGETVGGDDQRPHLVMHRLDRSSRRVRIIFGSQVLGASFRRPVFEIRHVDIHDAVHQLDALERIVPARVVDDWNIQAMLHGDGDCFQHLRDDMFRSHEVDIVTAAPLQAQHHRGYVFGRRAGLCLLGRDRLADVVVLTEDAPQIAVGEENRPRPVPASEAILFTEVGERTAHHRVAAGFACGPLVLETVDATIARAHPAILERPKRFFHSPAPLHAAE